MITRKSLLIFSMKLSMIKVRLFFLCLRMRSPFASRIRFVVNQGLVVCSFKNLRSSLQARPKSPRWPWFLALCLVSHVAPCLTMCILQPAAEACTRAVLAVLLMHTQLTGAAIDLANTEIIVKPNPKVCLRSRSLLCAFVWWMMCVYADQTFVEESRPN